MPPSPKRPLVPLLLTVFLDLLGFGIIIPLLPFFAMDLGAGPLAITALVAAYSLMQFLMAPIWGRLSDRYGRRPILLISITGSAVGLLMFGFATSYWALLASRVVHGAMNANIAVAQAYIADVTTPEKRAAGMGMFGAAVGMGFVFGPATGGLLGHYGPAIPAFVAASLAGINLALATALLPESRTGERPSRAWRLLDIPALRRAFRSSLGALLLVSLLFMIGFSAMEATFSLWSERALGWAERETGLLFTYIGVLIAIVQGGLIPPLRARFGERALARAGLLGLALGLGALPLATTLPLILLDTGILAVANGLLVPTLSALISFEGRVEEQGSVLGLHQSTSALGRVVGPLLGGWAFSALGIGWPFFLGGALMAACLLLLGAVAGRRAGA